MRIKIIMGTLLTMMVFSCSSGIEGKVTKNWKVVKMERSTRPVDVHPNMAYIFKQNNTLHLTTQIGSKLQGTWSLKDSILTIHVEGERKEFAIQELTDNKLTLVSGEFAFYLENNE